MVTNDLGRAQGAGNGARGVAGPANASEPAPEAQRAVRVVVGGKVETVSPSRAARLLTERAAELPEDISIAEAQAILSAEDERQEVSRRTLRLELASREAGPSFDRFGGREREPGALSLRRW